MKKIILIGAVYYENLGDAALCVSTQNLLSRDYEIKLLDIYGRSSFPAEKHVDARDCYAGYKKIVLRNRIRDSLLHIGIVPYDSKKKKTLTAIESQLEREMSEEKPEAIVFAGGALLKGVFLNSIERIVTFANNHKIPVMFSACGIDSEMRSAEWKKLNHILHAEAVKYVSVRDGCALLKDKYPDITIKDTVDPAVCVNRIYKKSDTRSGIGLGIMLSHKYGFEQQVRFWKSLIDRLNREGYKWKMFTNGSPADQSFAEYMLIQFGEKMDHLVVRPTEPSVLYSTISGFESIVSMRLHSHILAYSSDTPSIAISWDQKIDEFFYKIGKKDNCLDFSASAEAVFHRIKATERDAAYFENKKKLEQSVDHNIKALIEAIG